MHLYEVLKRPIVTEKTMIATDDYNKVTFEVDMRANKIMVKQAVEMAFDVDVLGVNILVMPAKTARRGKQVYASAIRSGKRQWCHWPPAAASNCSKACNGEADEWLSRFIDPRPPVGAT
jgi:large subunit ribosomal protein L23